MVLVFGVGKSLFAPSFWGLWAAPGGGELENTSCMEGEEFQVIPRREGKGGGRGGNEGMAPNPSCSSCDYLLSPLAEVLLKSGINPRIPLPPILSLPLEYSLPIFFQQPFPKKFPFSEFVPKVYSQIKEFIYACLKFSEDLHLRWGIFATNRELNVL